MEKEIIYVGNGKQVHENIINISINLTDLPKEHIFSYDGKKYIRLSIMKKKQVDKYGKSHYVTVNQWEAEKQEVKPAQSEPKQNNVKIEPSNDLPF